MNSIGRMLVLALVASAAWPQAAAAQEAAASQAAATQAVEDDPDMDPNPSQPDFAIVNLPTTLRLPRFKSAFRVTHRFARPLGQGDAGDLAEDLFGLDSGAQIGLEYRFGLMRGLQVGIHRTSERTIQFFSRYNLLNQADGAPIGLDASVSIDGRDNFSDDHSPAVGAVLSRELGSFGAVYVEPMWVNNANAQPDELTDDDDDTFMLGLGARIRVRPTVYVVAELIPRTGFEPNTNHATFGLEKRAGGHVFQINFSNGFGTTLGQLARGGTSYDDWYLGFNISRKFF
jgi:hypothetical protein